MNFLAPSTVVTLAFGASGAEPIFRFGMWWSVLSAGWLHGSALHILFNMLWVRQLGPATADVYGAGRMVIIYTVSSATGFLLSSIAGLLFAALPIPFLRGASFTLGASAPIFGLLGALVYYGRRGGSSMIGDAGEAVRDRAVSLRAVHGRHRQLRARGRVSRRLPDEHLARPAEARAHGPSRHRRSMPGRHGPGDCGLADQDRSAAARRGIAAGPGSQRSLYRVRARGQARSPTSSTGR